MNKNLYLKELIKYDFDNGNDNGYNTLANLLFNNKYSKYLVDKLNKFNSNINEKFKSSKTYIMGKKIFPFAFFCSSILILPSIYIFKCNSP